MTALRSIPCRGTCQWSTRGAHREGMLLFSCSGCGSQWVRSEAWTPADADGRVPEAVQAERATGGHGGASAGTPGS